MFRKIFKNTVLLTSILFVLNLVSIDYLAHPLNTNHSWIHTSVNQEYPALIQLYKHLHANPEISFHEVKTSTRIGQELKNLGFQVTTPFGGYGVVGMLKNGEGPKFLELHTDRWLEHCGPNYDDDLGYRSKIEIKKSRENDPIKILEKKFPELSSSKKNSIKKELNLLTEQAFVFAENSNFPPEKEAYTNLYSQ